jgi:EmrB/QacA subfamily drug resistance transporter
MSDAHPDMIGGRRLVTTVALLVGTFLASLEATVVGTAMPSIVGEMRGLELYGWVFAGYLLTSTVTVPLYGKLCDRWGRKPTYLLGIALFLGGSIACGAAWSMPILIAARMIQGLGAGAIIPTTMTLFGDLYPVERRARLQGIFSLVWGVSSLLGPSAGGLIVDYFSWPWIFWINVPIGLAACAVLALSLRERVIHTKAPIDIAGACLLVITISSSLLAPTFLESGDHTYAWIAALVAIAGVALFVVVERRARDPILPLSLLSDPVIRIAAPAGVFLGGTMYALIAYVPLLMAGVHGTSAVIAGSALIPFSISWTAMAFVAGRVILRAGYRVAVRTGVSLVAVGACAVAISTWMRAPLAVALTGMLVGAGMGLTVTSFNVVVQDRVEWQRRGAATSLLLFTRTIGATVFVSVLGVVLAAILDARLPEAAPDASTLVSSDTWATLDPAILNASRTALGGALAVVFTAAALAAVCAFGVALFFPKVSSTPRAR